MHNETINATINCYLYDFPDSETLDSEWSAEAWQCLSQAERKRFGAWDDFHALCVAALDEELRRRRGRHQITGAP